MKVNLFIAGACKSGTSYLHEFLSNQKDICGSSPKEPYFFELPIEVRNEANYHSKYFQNYNQEKYVLDGRHRTMFFDWIPKAVHEYNSDSKFIFILRDPIERAFSHWWMWYGRSILKTRFKRTILNEIRQIHKKGLKMNWTPEQYAHYIKTQVPETRMAYADYETIVESGLYAKQIQNFSSWFSEDQFLILDFNELKDAATLKGKLDEFLKIKLTNLNTELVKKNQAIHHKKVRSTWAQLIPPIIKSRLKDLLFSKPKISSKSRKILHEFYLEDRNTLIEDFKLEFPKKWQ